MKRVRYHEVSVVKGSNHIKAPLALKAKKAEEDDIQLHPCSLIAVQTQENCKEYQEGSHEWQGTQRPVLVLCGQEAE